jgi:flagellin
MFVIKNNVLATNASRYLSRSYNDLSKSIERLSSGLRINSAKDDAAGLAVRELMRADIAVLEQGSRNAQDGISLLQTMEGAMAVVDDALIRMKQLAEQASTGSYSTAQRTVMQNEFDEMRKEIDRIASATKFNNIQMLNSASDSVTIHFGESSDNISVSTANLTSASNALNTTGLTIANTTSAQAAISRLDSAISTKDTARSRFGYFMNRLESTLEVINIQKENMIASESRVSDIDVATEISNLTRNKVLAQAGTAMLAQANTVPQMALKLLK